jgi:hypothetical protein
MIPRASDAVALRRASETLALAERNVLARENALKTSASGGTSHTTYKYAFGPDGARYIVGAEVSIIAPEDVLDRVPGVASSLARGFEPHGKNSSGRDRVNDETIAELERTEREVIAHENAHKASAGRFGGPVRYSYTTGPDGKRYISGGEVPIHTPATNDPDEALRNARQVMNAALAPGDPSSQDITVAASASAMAASARARLASEKAVGGYRNNLSPNGLWTAKNSDPGKADLSPALGR